MPVQTRQQAHVRCLLCPQHSVLSTSAGLLPASGMVQSQPAATLQTDTPQTAGRRVRRRLCEASPTEEQMVADMQAYEQQMLDGFLEPPSCPADTTKAAATANQRDLLSLQREAQALQDAEAQMQRDLEAAAEVAAETEYLRLCWERLHDAADLILNPSKLVSLQIAKDAAQQAEVQRLERELQQVKTLHKEDMVRCSGLQQTNRYACWPQLQSAQDAPL